MGGTDYEKLMLMLALLQELGDDGQLAGVRTEEWGPLDESLPGAQNFQEVAIRFGGEGGRWYAPHAEDAVAGSLPASWGTCITLTPKPGLMEEAAQFNAVAQKKIIEQANEDITTVTPELIQERIDAALADAHWYKIETVKPN
jgi:hypothetical protein